MTPQTQTPPEGSVLIELGWPAKALSPNFRSRSHWPKTNALKKAKEEGFFAAKAFGGKLDGRPVKVVLTAYPPTKHARDADNLLASCKGQLDGIAKALGVDDSIFDPRVQWGEPVKGGKIVVAIG
jgi:crossover junction endodeoxyribonuclease RusA